MAQQQTIFQRTDRQIDVFTEGPICRIGNVARPIRDNDVIILKYLKDEVIGVLDGTYVKVAGDTMTGLLVLSGAPTDDLHAATKKYVDDLTGTIDTWAEILALGNTSGGTNVLISNNDGIVVGHTAQIAFGEVTSEMQVLGQNETDASLAIGLWSATDTLSPVVKFMKSGSASIAVENKVIVSDNEALGKIQAYGADNSDLNTLVAEIAFNVDDETPATGAIGGEMVFKTAATNGTLTNAITIDNEQRVGIGTDNPGVLLHLESITSVLSIVSTNGNSALNLRSEGSGSDPRINFTIGGVNKIKLGINLSGGYLLIETATNQNLGIALIAKSATKTIASLLISNTGNVVINGGRFATSGEDLINSPPFMFQTRYWNGIDNVSNFEIEHIIETIAPTSRLAFSIGSNEYFSIKSSGDIGINIDTPLAKLHIDQSVDSAAIPVLTLDQADNSEELINYLANSAASVANPISTWTSGNTIQGFVRVGINNSFYWMPYYDAPSS